MYLFSLNEVTRGLITSRPSKTCKTPYVADIVIDGDDTTEELCHSPSLGCCGEKAATWGASCIVFHVGIATWGA